MLDADQSWSISDAISRLRRLEKYDPTWIEEPLPPANVEELTRLGHHTRIARAGGEDLYSLNDFHRRLKAHALDILQPDIAHVGGLTNALKVCHLAQSMNLLVTPRLLPELSMPVALGTVNCPYIEYVTELQPLLATPLHILDGFAVPSESPGHGIRFDPEAIQRYGVKRGWEHKLEEKTRAY
jgi:L-alanine-DL-glutamate epimerase-like enolase superfamily enzyme